MTGISGLILAGGAARRMGGGDKALLTLAGRPMVAHVIERAKGQVLGLALSASGDPARFAAFGLPVLADAIPGFAGPLAGILSGLEHWAGRSPDAQWMASFAIDTPLFPDDLVRRLAAAAAAEKMPLACVRSRGRTHPVFALWRIDLAGDLRRALVEEGVRKVETWTARHGVAIVDYDDGPLDPFFNVNTPDDLREAERLIAEWA